MSENKILQFNIENPPNLYANRGSNFSLDTDNPEENSRINDNIIFQEDSLDIGKRKKSAYSKAYCGIRGDSVLSGILNVTVSAIGGGCFSYPYMMYQGGILVILFIFLFVTACIYYSIDLLRSFVVDTKYFSFALMTETILGTKWLKTYAFCSFVIYVSMVINYLSSIYMYTKGIFGFEGLLPNIFYFLITIIIEIIICIYISKLSNMMHFLSIVSIASLSLIILGLIIISIIANTQDEHVNKFIDKNLFFPNINPNIFSHKLLKISSFITSFVYGYSYHSTLPTLLGHLNNVNNSNTRKIHLISFSIVVFTYMTVTFFGFIVDNDVPIKLFQENGKEFNEISETFKTPFKIALIIYLLTLVPIRFIVIRDNYVTLIGKKKINFLSELVIIIIFIFISNIFVYGISTFQTIIQNWDVSELIQAFGGMFGVIISFCLPVINYVSVNGKRKLKSIIGYLITGFFVIVGFLSLSYTIYKIIIGEDKTEESSS